MLRLVMLGGLRLEDASGPVSGRIAQRRRRALLALLSVPPGRLITRDRVAALLWPDLDDARARGSLSTALSEFRAVLGEDAFLTPGDELGLNPGHLGSDVAEFLAALEAGDLEGAVALYGGAFLGDQRMGTGVEFEHWADSEGQRLARKYREALEELARTRGEAGDLQGSAEAWRRLATEDPCSKRVALGYMEALVARGERADALRFADVHTALLRDQLEAEPDPEVLAFVERLRTEPPSTTHDNPAEAAEEDAESPEPAREEAAQEAAADDPAPPTNRPRRRTDPVAAPPRARRAVLYLGLFLVVAAPAVTWAWFTLAPGPEVRIAVLPFVSQGETPEDRAFADGVTEEIRLALSMVEGLQVTGRTSSFAYRNTTLDGPQVARELRVDYLLSGTVDMSEDGLRIMAHLENELGHLEWGQRYEHGRENLWQTQEEIAQAVVGAVWHRFARKRAAIAESGNPPMTPAEVRAHEHLTRGRGYFIERSHASLLAALAEFEQVIALEPAHKRAYAGIADVYNVLGAWDYGIVPPDTAFPKARRAAETALGLDRDLPEARAALGTALFNYYWSQWDRAELELTTALEVNPGDATARHWYALLLAATDRGEQAMGQIREARATDPKSAIIAAAFCRHLYFQRAYDEALDECDTAIALQPDYTPAFVARGLVAVQQGDFEGALEAYTAARGLPGGDRAPLLIAALAHVHGRMGDTITAVALHEQLRAAAVSQYVAPQFLTLSALGAGREREALDWLEAAFRERSGVMIYLAREPLLDDLRDHPRFRRLLEAAAEAGIPFPAS